MSLPSWTSRIDYRWMRWIIASWLMISIVLNLVDRQTLSILAPFLRANLNIGVEQYSYVVACFMVSYGVMYAVSGWFVDRVGERRGMALCIAWWSVWTMATGLVQGFWSLAGVRFMLGLGEPGNYPAALKAITRWFPKNERGLPIAVFSSGGAIGNMIAAPSIAFVALYFGWRAAFVLPGLLGLLWLAGWMILYRMPKDQAGGAEMLDSVPGMNLEARPAPSWISLFGNRNVMAMVLARFISDPVAYFYIFWIPEYLKHARGFTLVEIGKYAWIPYVAGAIGGMAGGRWSDVLIRKGHSPVSARLSVLYLSAMIAPLGIMTSRVSSASMALVLMSVMSFIVYCWFINTAAMIPDIAPEQQAGSILGLIGTSGTFGGMLFNLLVGYLVARSGSYQVVFAIVGSVHVIAAVLLRILLRVPPAEDLAWKECHEA